MSDMSDMMNEDTLGKSDQKNVFEEPLEACSIHPVTGFYRNGCCDTGSNDHGSHTVCAEMTAEFFGVFKSQRQRSIHPSP